MFSFKNRFANLAKYALICVFFVAGCNSSGIYVRHASYADRQIYAYEPIITSGVDGITSHRKNLVDFVVVNKSHYQMILYKNGQEVRKYWIALSDRPTGPKVRQGDRRTPEGLYTLDYVKENSYYYRAFHISYPNEKDIENARRLGVNPGGLIMVHGQPPSDGEYHPNIQRSNWTNGCIAILNHEMDEFISLVDPGTPIQINP